MLDSENRINAAQHFLERARSEARAGNELLLRWNIQASVVFSVSATEVLPAEFGAKLGSGPNSRERKISFRDWLRKRLGEVDLYPRMNNERNLILHPGEPDKIVESLEISSAASSNPILRICFQWNRRESADTICDDFIQDIRSMITDAKNRFEELGSAA